MLRSAGIQGTLMALMHRATERYHELRWGIDTDHVIEPHELGIKSNESHAYVPTDFTTFHKVMRRIPVRKNHDVLLDWGSGMGRVLIMGGMYPFERIVGVELSPQLNRIAEDNIRRVLPKLRCRKISTVTADAAHYEVPDDVTLVYCYNPFHGDIFASALHNLKESLDRKPRLRLICNMPFESERLVRQASHCPWLRKVTEFPFPPATKYVLWESTC